jgi:hypothetical protein
MCGMEPTEARPSESRTPENTGEVEALKARVSSQEDQLAHIKEHGGRMFDVVKWAMVLFMGVAGLNWWTGKTSYDRDKELLKDQAKLLEKQLALSQQELGILDENRLNIIRSQIESNMLRLASVNDTQLADIRTEAKSSVTNLITSMATQFVASVSHLMTAMSNVNNAVQSELDTNRQRVNATINTLAMTNDLIISNLVSELEIAILKSEGLSLGVQGLQLCTGNKAKKIKAATDMAIGVSSFTKASLDYLKAKDEADFRRSIARLNEYLPILMKNAPLGELPIIDDMFGMSVQIDQLVQSLEQRTENNRYEMETAMLEQNNKVFKKLIKEQREMKIYQHRLRLPF